MNNFANSFRQASNWTKTENQAVVKSTTGSSLLNLFARIGGMRNATESEITRMWQDARRENKELADNLILYTRSIRDGGIGERRIGRILLKEIAKTEPDKVSRNLSTIVNAGRWDDLYCLEGTKVWTDVLAFLEKQLKEDIVNMAAEKPISLLAKWLKSENTSSRESRRIAKEIRTSFGLTERKYRKTLSALRRYLNVVEKKMSAQEFGAIDYEKVPSLAMTRYRSAFGKHDYERFNSYIQSVTKGEAKINSSVLYPYDIIRPYVRECNDSGWRKPTPPTYDAVLEEQWKALPNYVEGDFDVLVMPDVSGSMNYDNYTPLATATSLAIYFAERNKGAYHGLVMAFTDKPCLYDLDSNDSVATRTGIVNSHTGYNTNLEGAFAAVLEQGKKCHDVPRALVVISDGEIDSFLRRNNIDTLITKWERQFAMAGLDFPKVIMWNVNSSNNHFLEDLNNPNISFISGSSAATFKELTTLITKDAYTAMVEILSKPAFRWK